VALASRRTAPLVERLCREITMRTANPALPITTIFVGGGTPTLLDRDSLAALLDPLAQITRDNPVCEFTVEANPATVDEAMVNLLVDAGVTRVSMGAQSFFAAELAALERLHSPQDIAPSVAALRGKGTSGLIAQVNLDLIFGIPGQTLQTWAQSLERAIDLNVDHLACYALTYEPGTSLTAQKRRGRITPCPDSLEADMYELAIDTLAQAGYAQYEISNFAQPGCQCQHNLVYWRNQPYIAAGPSAAGCLDRRRYKNVANIEAYIRLMDYRGDAVANWETLDWDCLMTEMVMMQLRLNQGLSIAAFQQRLKSDPRTVFAQPLGRLTKMGLVIVSNTHIALTRSGRLMTNAIIAELVAAA